MALGHSRTWGVMGQSLLAAPAVLCQVPLAYSDTGNCTGGSFLLNSGKEGHHKGSLSNNTCSSFS